MTLITQPIVRTLSDYVYTAIHKHLKKILKWEKKLKKDQDPRALHKMRVEMRRLRTIISKFEFVVVLPPFVTERNIALVAGRLGNVRDLDILKESLKHSFQPHLPSQELGYLEKAFDAIDNQSSLFWVDVKATLRDARYKLLIDSLCYWLEQPVYQQSALCPISLALPDLLLPEISCFLLHPGWQFGVPIASNKGVSTSTTLLRSYLRGMTKAQVEQSLDSRCEVLHSLRKQAKRLSYQMELFTEFYGEMYEEHLIKVKNVKNVLGAIRDYDILEDWFTDVFGKDFTKTLPTFTSLLIDKRHQLWQQWVLMQRHHNQFDTRSQLYRAILYPISM